MSGRSVRACAVISLLAAGAAGQPPISNSPAIALLDAADAEQWRAWTASRGFKIVTGPAAADKPVDLRILELQKAVQAAIENSAVDRDRVYLAGRGDAASAVFYAGARLPEPWAAVVAIGGSPQPAIDTNRFFSANFTNLPVLWIGAAHTDKALAEKLEPAGLNLEFRAADGLTTETVLDWLLSKRRHEYPASVDCETTSPSFAGCYWIQMTKFDPAARNDVLGSSRMQPRSLAALDLGGFGYKTDDPGPGILVNWLPEKYSGPLKLNDRIVALGGKPVKDAREYAAIMEKATEEKEVVATVQRGDNRVRLETRIVLPKRDETFTARVQGKYLAEEGKEIQIVSRTVAEMRVTVPAAWAGATINWNGTAVAKTEASGCWLLAEEKQLPRANPCP